jgi:amino acid transporter
MKECPEHSSLTETDEMAVGLVFVFSFLRASLFISFSTLLSFRSSILYLVFITSLLSYFNLLVLFICAISKHAVWKPEQCHHKGRNITFSLATTSSSCQSFSTLPSAANYSTQVFTTKRKLARERLGFRRLRKESD